jgi:predicted nucleic acid-binding protein
VTVANVLDQLFANRTTVTIGPRAARGARNVAGVTRLRASDALYVWVVAREALALVTVDEEVIRRAGLAGVTATMPSSCDKTRCWGGRAR